MTSNLPPLSPPGARSEILALCPINVERAFRNLKTVQLEIRSVYHIHDDRIRSHVCLCLLAYYLQWHMEQRLAPFFNGAEFYQNSTPILEQEQILRLLEISM